MATPARPAQLPETVLIAQRGAERVRAALARVEGVRPRWILLGLVAVEWAAVAALARTVVHNGWVYYQGGDQLWYYTSGWLVLHGHMPNALVGDGWSVVLAPFAAVFGPNLADAMPAIVLLQVVVLLPVGVLAAYGIGERLGGRLFGYWVALLWIGVPFLGIWYADTGYHQRYTELTLPQGLGLSAMADFPAMVLLAVSAYLVLRTLDGSGPVDGVLAGLTAGAAISMKPSSSLFLAGAALALVWTRRWRGAAAVAAGLAAPLIGLAVWKWRGFGYLPLLHADGHPVRLAAGVSDLQPIAFLGLHQYVHLDWHHLNMQLLSIRDHFFSVRVIEWVAFAGVIALARRSRPAALLFGAWFFAFVVVKGTFGGASIDGADLLRLMLGCAPAFVLLVAAVPLLVPGVPRRLRRSAPRPWGAPRLRTGLVVAGVVLTGVVPVALAAAATPLRADQPIALSVSNDVPVPVDTSVRLTATADGGSVRLAWPAQRPSGGKVFYRVFRAPAGTQPDCSHFDSAAVDCALVADVVGTTSSPSFTDTPKPGAWDYRVGVSTNWRNDPTYGDVYVLSPAATATTG